LITFATVKISRPVERPHKDFTFIPMKNELIDTLMVSFILTSLFSAKSMLELALTHCSAGTFQTWKAVQSFYLVFLF